MPSDYNVDIYTALVPAEVDLFGEDEFDVAVVIDVLRATTTLLFALKSGAERIIPAESVDVARQLKQKFPDALLCGERNGTKIPGFDLGNSPVEYTPENVRGKVLIYASTNGSVMMKKVSRVAKRVFLASLRNVSAAAEKIYSSGARKVLVACSGREGFFSLEDAYCAGMLYEELEELAERQVRGANDGTTLAYSLVRYFGYAVDEIFHRSEHARYLASLGLGEDISLAGEVDADSIVPEVVDGEVRVL
ncbi:MAG TPA: 2-phosphosulfolactate phosphatase [candidate division Zixibacteria bacterium]|nr:2-phosphosulfolactate phosphatase [candidate division Zixibacteria bacterium]